MNYRFDEHEVRRAAELLFPPAQVFELRALNCRISGEWRPGTFSGYFQGDHIDELVAELWRIESASAVYITPNPVNPALLGRACNRSRIVKEREPLTSDRDIIARRWLLIDVDPVRPAGVSATEAEKQAAAALAVEIDHWAWEQGFPPGLICDSGNGAHVMLPVELPADDGGFCQRMLAVLDKQFSTAAAKVDLTVFNPARIWKLPGTMSCKGDHAPEIGREWRMARIESVCKEVCRND